MTPGHLSSLSLLWTGPCAVWEMISAAKVTPSTWTGNHCSWREFSSPWDKRHVPSPPRAGCHVALYLLNQGIVLLGRQTPLLFCFLFSVADIVSFSPWLSQGFFVEGLFLCLHVRKVSSFLVTSLWLLGGLYHGLLLLTLPKDWIDGGFFIRSRCPNNSRHLTVYKALSYLLTYSFSQRDGPCMWWLKVNVT